MSETLQWIAVTLIVAAAVVHVYRRFNRKKRGPECCCESCPLGADYAASCNKRTPPPECPGRA